MPRLEIGRFLPSSRSVVAGAALLLSGLIAFAVARQTSIFAISTIEVAGASPALERQVRAALAPLVGTSLIALDSAAVTGRLNSLPQVRQASYDRAFPNTLRIVVEPDHAVAVVRSGPDGWLVSGYGAVLRKLSRPFPADYPRIWLSPADAPVRGRPMPARMAPALRGLAEARRLQSALVPEIRTVRAVGGQLTLELRSSLELRLGEPRDVALKLAVANQVLASLTADERVRIQYLDLTLPSRPVTGKNPQL